MSTSLRRIIALVILVGVLLTAGPWVYINFVKDDAPDALSLETQTEATNDSSATPVDINGEWKTTADADTVVGYRVKEILFGQSTEGVGRTQSVVGSLSIADDAVGSASFTVQMGTLVSDDSRRDNQFKNRIMDVTSYPEATFTLTNPISLPPTAATGGKVTAQATGELTLRGTTKSVQFNVEARLTGSTFTVVGSIPIVFDEWAIPAPAVPGISVDPDGLLEFSLTFEKAN